MTVNERFSTSDVAPTKPSTSSVIVPNPDVERIARLVARTLHVPMVYVVLFDEQPNGFVISFGVSSLAVAGAAMKQLSSLRAAAEPVRVRDCADAPRTRLTSIAEQVGARAFMAAPLVAGAGQSLGILCALDVQPRDWRDDENVIMQDFAQLVVTELELTFKVAELEQVRGELAEKHQLLRTLIDSSPDYIFVKDNDGHFVISNRAHAQAAGIDDPDLLIGKTALETFPAELAEQYSSDDMEVINSREPLINLERQTLDADGRLRWVLTSKVPIISADGHVHGLVGISRDITARKMAEAALRDREAFIQQVIATSPALIYIYDLAERRNVYHNVELFEILGYTPEEIRALGGDLFMQLMHPDDLSIYAQHLARLAHLRDDEVDDCEYRLRHRDGEYRWLYSRDVIFRRGADGQPVQSLGTALDITRVKRAEAALRESQARTRALVDSAPVILIETDLTGRITVAEGEGIRRFGYEPSALPGQNIHDLKNIVNDPKVTQRLRSAVEGEPVDFILDNDDVVFQFRFSPIFGLKTLHVMSVVIIGVDVTEQVRARDALVESNGRLSRLRRIDMALTETLDLAQVARTALQSAAEETNASDGCIALFEDDALRVVEALGRFVPGSIIAREGDPLSAQLRQGRALLRAPNAGDSGLLPLPGSQAQMLLPLVYGEQAVGVMVLESTAPRRFDEDTAEFVRSIALRAAAALENARLYAHLSQLYGQVSALEQVKTDMIRIAAHDLRNPLTALKGYLTLLTNDLQPHLTHKQQNYLAMLNESAATMHRIISEILSLQRIEAMQDQVPDELLDISALLGELHRRYDVEAGNHAVMMHWDYPAAPVFVRGDEAQLREAIDNLINNAVKYTPEGGSVTVRLYTADDGLHVEVQDTGYGIPADQQARLFQPFYRARTPATRQIDGTGLGLHLVKKIIERHTGDLYFRSAEGEGSLFGFRLPHHAAALSHERG